MVLQVYAESRRVDLIRTGGIQAVERDVPYSALRSVDRQAAQALELFLRYGRALELGPSECQHFASRDIA